MLLDQNSSILYPKDFKVEKKSSKPLEKVPKYFQIPHKALSKCQDEMDSIFSLASNIKADYVFVLAPLHKGKVFFDDPFYLYTYEDCFVSHPFLKKDDVVCSEEFSYELAIHYIKAYFPDAKSTCFFAPGASNELKSFIDFLKTNYPKCVFLVSNNKEANCSQMWKQAFEE